MTPRRADLDRAKGLAIMLVVFGHIVARADPAGVHWYEPLRRAVYAFHMPFFLYLSGMAAALSGAVLTPPPAYAAYAARRARRLLVPFFGLGLLILALKLLAGGLLHAENIPAGWRDGVAALFWNTAESPARSIWYVFVLFWFGVAAPPLFWLGRGRPLLFAGLCAALYLAPLPPRLYADDAGRYAIFFALGAAAGLAESRWLAFIDRHWRALAVLFASLLAYIVAAGDFVSFPVTLLLTGIISFPVLHGFVRIIPDNQASFLLWLGTYSFMIYLFNTLFIGLAKGLLLLVTGWDGAHFLPFAAALMLSGLFGPVALKTLAFRHAKSLDRMTN